MSFSMEDYSYVSSKAITVEKCQDCFECTSQKSAKFLQYISVGSIYISDQCLLS